MLLASTPNDLEKANVPFLPAGSARAVWLCKIPRATTQMQEPETLFHVTFVSILHIRFAVLCSHCADLDLEVHPVNIRARGGARFILHGTQSCSVAEVLPEQQVNLDNRSTADSQFRN